MKTADKATVHRVIDGDTIVFDVDLNYNITTRVQVRLVGVDTAETYNVSESSPEYKLGKKHERFVRGWLDEADEIYLRTDEKGKFGRWLGEVFNKNGESLNDKLLEEFNVTYD